MTPHDFCNWLEGYLAGAEKPDAEVIMAKLQDVAPAQEFTWPLPAHPLPNPTYPTWARPYIGDSTEPYWPNGTIICGQTQ